jgi:hypothetical protein
MKKSKENFLMYAQKKVTLYKICTRLSENEEKNKIVKIEPIMGDLLLARDYFLYVIKRYSETGKLMAPRVVGCALSHISALNEIINSNQPGVILEEDIEVEDLHFDLLAKLNSIGADFIQLGVHPNELKGIFYRGHKIEDENIYLLNKNQTIQGAFAYYITPKAASYVVQHQLVCLKEADLWNEFFIDTEIEVYFYKIFFHPSVRGDLNKQRLLIPGSPILPIIKRKFKLVLGAVMEKIKLLLSGSKLIR